MNLGGIALFPYHLQWAPYGLVFSLPTLIPVPYKIEIFFATFCFINCYSISSIIITPKIKEFSFKDINSDYHTIQGQSS